VGGVSDLEMITLTNDHWRVGLVPENGGSVAFGQARIDGNWIDVLRPTPKDRLGQWWDVASFPLIPWSNRIRHGTLLWEGEAYQLRRWGTDDFAMHGTAVDFPWEVLEQAVDHTSLEFDARGYYGVNFPWDFVSRTEFTLDGPSLTCRMTIENTDDEAFPAGLGHHPYFVRALHSPTGAALGEEALLQVNCEHAYPLTNGMPDGPAGPLPPVADFRTSRALGDALVDHCLTARVGTTVAATIEYPGALTVDIKAGDLLSHVVVFVPVGESYFAVEPVTNANDAFTLHAQGVPDTGVFIIEPGETAATEFALILR